MDFRPRVPGQAISFVLGMIDNPDLTLLLESMITAHRAPPDRGVWYEDDRVQLDGEVIGVKMCTVATANIVEMIRQHFPYMTVRLCDSAK